MPDPHSVFPSQTWDGLTPNSDRIDLNSQVNPNLYDFNQLRAEVLALQDYVRALLLAPFLQNRFRLDTPAGIDGGSYTQYNLQSSVENRVVLVDASAKNARVYLPDPSEHGGIPIAIIKIDGTANTVTVYPFAAETIQGQSTKIIAYRWSTMVVAAPNYDNWYIL